MHILITALLVIFVVDSFMLTVAVLMQSGRGGGLAGALGGGAGGESALGTRATSTIAKITWILAAVFLFVCLVLAWLTSSARTEESLPLGAPVNPPAATTPASAPESETGK